jgi:hypothetical protein
LFGTSDLVTHRWKEVLGRAEVEAFLVNYNARIAEKLAT